MPYLKRTWYMAGWSEELGEQLLSRRLFDQQLLLYREPDDAVAVIADRCPHRFAPLSLGTKLDGMIVCGYHGLAFDSSGACVRNPFSEKIPAAAHVQNWAAVERYGIIWVWGDTPQSADTSLIPDFSAVANSESVKVIHGHTHFEVPYEFVTDNLMDLSHIEFVHKGTFAGAGVIFAGTHNLSEDGDTLHSNWWMPNIPAPSHTRGVYPLDLMCDHWLDMRWNAPGSMYLQVGATPSGGERSTGFISHQAHILTPASATSTHYFWAVARGHDLGSAEVDNFMLALFGQAFDEEDKPIIKAAYDNLEGEDFWDAKPLSLGIDRGGTRARRKIQALLKAEDVQ